MMSRITANQQIRFGAILSYLGIVVYILIGLLYTPWMIDVIGKDDYGLYTLTYSIISFFVFDFGMSAAIQRYLSKYLAEGNQIKIDHFLSIVSRLYLCVDVLILLVLTVVFFSIPYIYTELTLEQISRLKVVYVIAAMFSVISFPFIPLNGILSANEKFIQLKSCDLLSKLLTVIINIVCLYAGGGLYELILTNVTIALFFTIVKLVIARKQTRMNIDLRYYSRSELFDILSFSGWTTVVALCQRCIFNIAPTILGMFACASVIGVFGIAVSLEAYTFTLAFALNGLFLPKISRILNHGEDILPLMVKVGRIQIWILGLVLIGFVLIGQDFIYLWLGPDFSEAYFCTILLILPTFFALPADIADQTLIASGKVRYRAYVYIMMALINLPLSYLLTSFYGIYGLAFSIFLAYMIRTIGMYYVYYKQLHINVLHFFINSYGKMVPGLVIALVFAYVIIIFIAQQSWICMLLKMCIITVSYIVITVFFSMNNAEKQMLYNAFMKIINRTI